MAEAAVLNFVVRKLNNFIHKEIHLLGGVLEKAMQMQFELNMLNCVVTDVDSKLKRDEMVQNWLNDLCNVAYRIEDATDTFLLEIEDNCQKDSNFLKISKKLLNKPGQVQIVHKLGTEFDGILNELKTFDYRSFRLIIHASQHVEQALTREAVEMLPFRRSANLEINLTEIVGLQEDQKNILKLLSAAVPRRTVITIVGAGGLGKTTLARMVYNSARADFEYHIMLSISQQYNLTDLCKKMLRQVKHSLPENLEDDVTALQIHLRSFLSSRRYLIILDDVWTVDLWDRMKHSLPDANNGSRVLMTSRFLNVAKFANFEMAPYKLNFLDEKESLNLLLKRALCYQDLGEKCPSPLLEVATKLSKKCKGLPLALIVLGGILSTKETSYSVWESVLQTMNWHSEGKDCMQVVAMSYEDLPYLQKACFLYFALFPEDYEIPAKHLIRMWVAEGFIPHRWSRTRTMEEMAENYLEDLVERSIVEVSSRHINGSIKSCQVRGLLHDLAVHEAGHRNFVTVFSQALDATKPNKEIRRASLQFPHQDQQRNPRLLDYVGSDSHFFDTPGYVGQNTRSLLFFGFGRCFLLFGFVLRLPECSNFRLLKVLELVGVTNYADDLVRGLDELIQLKYLGFRNCLIEIPSCSIRRMRSLETLDVRGTLFDNLNNAGLWEIDTLRHVLCDDDPTAALTLDGPTIKIKTLDGPLSTANLSNLQSMRWVSPRKEWDRELPHLNNLCMLGLRNPFGDWATVTNLVPTLPSLVSLGIKGVSLPMEIVYPHALPKYQNLHSLYLEGNWSENVTLKASLFPPYLRKLTLIQSQLKQNPMPELGKLQSLKKLCLREHVRNYSGPTTCPEGFPFLQYLEVGDSSIKNLMVEKGVMPKLTYLKIHDDIEFKLSPELQQVTVVIR